MVTTSWSPPLTQAALNLMANPTYANQPEVIPWGLYDSVSIATAATGPFVLFQNVNADKTLSNMEGPGQLPDPQYLIVDYLASDFMRIPDATVTAIVPGALADISNIQFTCRETFQFQMSNKNYGPFPITMTAATGGPTGFALGYGSGTAANNSVASVLSGRPGSGGFPFCGALVIPPKIGFSVTLQLAVAATLVATFYQRVVLVGPLYRRVL